MNRSKAIIATTVASVFFISGAMATEPSPKEEAAGFGIGAVIGGLVGGPVGIVAGAGLGVFFGNQVATAKEVEPLKEELAASRKTGQGLQEELQLVRSQLQERDELMAELHEREARLAGLQLEVLFTTGNAYLDTESANRMAELAGIIRSRPDLVLELDGFADERGNETYNLDLSRARAESVASALTGLGVDPGQIVVRAHGELAGPEPRDSLDSMAFSRRVTLRFSDAGGQLAENR